jgi:hypothetical protein
MAAPIKVRDYAGEYARRAQRAMEAGYTGYGQQRRMQRYGPLGAATPGVRPSAAHRIQDAVGYQDEVEEDWEFASFASSRVDRARYSPSRRELQVAWTNAPSGVPYSPYIYDGVDPATWTNFRLAGSAGSYVNTNLNNFPYRSAPDTIGDY